MTDREYAPSVIEYFYEEGERDFVHFGQIVGVVSFDSEDAPVGKSERQRFDDAVELVRAMVSTGDFQPGRTLRAGPLEFTYELFQNGVEGFVAEATEQFIEHGIDDINLAVGFWIKKVKLGQTPPGSSVEWHRLIGHPLEAGKTYEA